MTKADPLEGVFEYTGPPGGYPRHKHAPATMTMTLRWGSDCGALLFEGWHPSSVAQYSASLAAVFALAVLAEAVRLGRFRRPSESASFRSDDYGAMDDVILDDSVLGEPRGGASGGWARAGRVQDPGPVRRAVRPLPRP